MGALLELAKRSKPDGKAEDTMPAATEIQAAAELATNDDRDPAAEARKARVLAFLEAYPNVKRACFADAKADPAHIVLTVAVRDPWGAVEVLVRRDRFDAFALMELAERYPATSLLVPEH